jgi:hypothetical protein
MLKLRFFGRPSANTHGDKALCVSITVSSIFAIQRALVAKLSNITLPPNNRCPSFLRLAMLKFILIRALA